LTEEDLIQRARRLYKAHAPAIRRLLGAPSIPPVTIEVTYDPNAHPGVTIGHRVILSWAWFSQREDDGAIIHEFAHVMQGARYDSGTSWLVEGMADTVRDRLGFTAPHSYPHYEPRSIRRGYQTTAHFLLWLERHCKRGGLLALATEMRKPAYSHQAFARIFGKPLGVLAAGYEKAFAARTTTRAD
jgi:hypothetical protein